MCVPHMQPKTKQPPQQIGAGVLAAHTDEDLRGILHQHSKDLVCVMFGSSWCHHCHEMFPEMYRTSKEVGSCCAPASHGT